MSITLKIRVICWEGEYLVNKTKEHGYKRPASIKSYAPNDLVLYDMAGNVW
jgi:sulfatase modifying factor 1